ncbi:MAG: hypothetical protein ABI880_10515 [Acidobacteriota bacterium]
MDPDLAALLAMVVVTFAISAKWNATLRAGPGYRYQQVFSLLAAGLLLLVGGLIGWDSARRASTASRGHAAGRYA